MLSLTLSTSATRQAPRRRHRAFHREAPLLITRGRGSLVGLLAEDRLSPGFLFRGTIPAGHDLLRPAELSCCNADDVSCTRFAHGVILDALGGRHLDLTTSSARHGVRQLGVERIRVVCHTSTVPQTLQLGQRPPKRLSRPADTRHTTGQLAALTEPYRAKALCASLGASQTLTDREMHRRSRVRLGESLDALTRVSRRVARSHSADMRKGARRLPIY